MKFNRGLSYVDTVKHRITTASRNTNAVSEANKFLVGGLVAIPVGLCGIRPLLQWF